jgi:hypothetical protein
MMKIEEKEIADPMWMGRFHNWPRWGRMCGKETTRMALVECSRYEEYGSGLGREMGVRAMWRWRKE